MPETITIAPVNWCSPPSGEDFWPTMSTCGMCCETATEDFMDQTPVRDFYRVYGGADDGLVVCDHCMEEYLRETPSDH